MELSKNIAVSDSGFLFNPASGESFSLNQSGKDLLNLIKDGKNEEEIGAIFLAKYDVDKSTFEQDYQDFVKVIEQYQLSEKK